MKNGLAKSFNCNSLLLRSSSSSIAFSKESFSASARVCCAVPKDGAHRQAARSPAPASTAIGRIGFMEQQEGKDIAIALYQIRDLFAMKLHVIIAYETFPSGG
jgi:hypothetical protein